MIKPSIPINKLSLGFAAVKFPWQAFKVAVAGLAGVVRPWRPPQWAPGQGSVVGELIYLNDSIEGLFFDAVIRLEHNTSRRITEHPIQNGANISDHSFQLPAKLTMEIGMSDAMDSLKAGQWPIQFKSYNAYQKLIALQKTGNPLTVQTRLNKYKNMIIEQINAVDDHNTTYGLRAMVALKQIILATVESKIVSSDATLPVLGETPKGTITATSPSGPLLQQIDRATTGVESLHP
jgi:hypothetical protein